MGKIYNADGARMNVAEICDEIIIKLPEDIRVKLGAHINAEDITETPNTALGYIAHAVLDEYQKVDSTTEEGTRLRKLLDYIMTKYQKSTPTADDIVAYKTLAEYLTK